MGLNGYRSFKQTYIDSGEEVGGDSNVVGKEHAPDFRSRNTVQFWNLVPTAENDKTDTGVIIFEIKDPKSASLVDRTVHEISVRNSTVNPIEVRFAKIYVLVDEDEIFDPAVAKELNYESIAIGPNGTAYFYATAIAQEGMLKLHLRTGSQDARNL